MIVAATTARGTHRSDAIMHAVLFHSLSSRAAMGSVGWELQRDVLVAPSRSAAASGECARWQLVHLPQLICRGCFRAVAAEGASGMQQLQHLTEYIVHIDS